VRLRAGAPETWVRFSLGHPKPAQPGFAGHGVDYFLGNHETNRRAAVSFRFPPGYIAGRWLVHAQNVRGGRILHARVKVGRPNQSC